jgi:putative effector of murein hydrolase LrgA (UPF0299 family)
MDGAILVFALLSIGPVGVAVIYYLALWAEDRFRISLRTLLIATTLIAMVLGLIVAMLRWRAG